MTLTGEVFENLDIKDIKFMDIEDMELLLKHDVRILIHDGIIRRFIYDKKNRAY